MIDIALNEKYMQELRTKCFSGDYEVDHGEADDVLCSLLEDLGYDELVKLYYEVGKWYA